MRMKRRTVEILLSLLPVIILIVMLALVIRAFGSDALNGGSQVSLLISAGVCSAISLLYFRIPWKTLEESIMRSVGSVTTAIIILLMIGAISGVWILSGVVPTLIHYGLMLIHPKFFLVTTCIICAIVSVLTGSSWSTIATIGIALLGIGQAQGFSSGLIAGAIISGAYFGDKISPMSDTTVLASSINKVNLFEHIRYMCITTVPSFVITLIIFTVLGLTHSGASAGEMEVYTSTLQSKFNITPFLMIVPIISIILIWRRLPALMVLSLSALAAAVAALVFQGGIVEEIGRGVTGGSPVKVYFAGIVEMVYNTVSLDTGNAEVNSLVTSRGMLGMLNTVYLIICAMCFGACMRASGMIADLSRILAPLTRTRTGLVASTVFTGTALNGIVSDQYLAIILTSNIYREPFEKNGYEPRLLSRSVEDSATVTSPLFPWSSCGMTQATILSVPTLVYAPFCFFCILSPLMSILIGAIGWKIRRKKQ